MKRAAFAVGAALVALGAYLVIEATGFASLRSALIWFGGGVVGHDGVLVPLTLLVGVALARWVPGTYRGLLQGALVVSAMLSLALVPLLSGRGLTAANPSQQPLPYGRNLLLVLAGVWALAAVLAVRRAVEERKAGRRVV